MTHIESIIQQAISQSNEIIKIGTRNVTNSSLTDSHKVSPEVLYDGSSGLITVVENRAEEPFLQILLQNAISENSSLNVVKDSLLFLESKITDQKSKLPNLVTAIDNFINDASKVGENASIAFKQAFVNNGIRLAETISNTTNEINSLKLETDKNIANSINTTNTIIKDLFYVNQSLARFGNSSELLDQRDRLINNLAEHFEIKVHYGSRGEALVSTHNGSYNIVNPNSYGHFNYSSINSVDKIISGQSYNDITMEYVDIDGKHSSSFLIVDGTDSSNTKILGGKIMGYINLRDTELVKAGQVVAVLANAVIDKVNDVHNKFSTFPPKTKIESTTLVSRSDLVNWDGKLTISALNIDGTSVKNASSLGNGAIRPVTIDLSTLPIASIDGRVTIEGMINEINAFLTSGPTSQRISLGEIQTSVIGPLQPKDMSFLLNDIKIAGMSNVDNAGNFTFDLELDGSKYFGSKVEILSVEDNAQNSILNGVLPSAFTLEKGQHLRTNDPVSVRLNTAAPDNIRVKIRVIGDNGVVEEGTAQFNYNVVAPANRELMNQRLIGVADTVAPAGKLMDIGVITAAPIARAKLVDDNGIEINPNDRATQGKLVIETIDNDRSLVITSNLDTANNGFNKFFGTNNFFVADTIPGTLKVLDNIVTDPSKLSTGLISFGNSLSTVKQGKEAASATMQFAGNILVGDTIDINNTIFTFQFPLTGAPNEVLWTAGPPSNNLKALVDAINASPQISPLINATFNGTDTITLTAKNPGTSGNLTIQAALTNNAFGGTVDITPKNGVATGPAANVNSALGGGTDEDVTVPSFEPRMGDSSTEFFSAIRDLQNTLLSFDNNDVVPGISTTLSGYAQVTTDIILNQINKIKQEANSINAVKNDFNERMKSKVGIDKKAELYKLVDYQQYRSAAYAIWGMSQRSIEELLRIINR